MERDFMGLNSKEPLAVVKEDINHDGFKVSGFTKGSIAQWPFSNKVSVLPHLMSFKASQDDKTKKIVSDPLTSGFMSILSQNAFDSSQKRSAGEPQAQAIMLLAGNSLSAASNMVQPKVQVLASTLAAGDGVPVSRLANTPPGSVLSSPLSVSSHTGAQSRSGSTCTDEFLATKTTGIPTAPVSNVEPPKVVNATTMLTSAVPQARKASLARFLEKRKERVMNAAPYNLNKKSEECATAGYAGAKFSAGTATNTVSVKQGK